MPQIFSVHGYTVYFWSNEGDPLEPVHVHISERPDVNATKVWITRSGRCLLCQNNSHIPERRLRELTRVVAARSGEVKAAWLAFFGEIRYFC